MRVPHSIDKPVSSLDRRVMDEIRDAALKKAQSGVVDNDTIIATRKMLIHQGYNHELLPGVDCIRSIIHYYEAVRDTLERQKPDYRADSTL